METMNMVIEANKLPNGNYELRVECPNKEIILALAIRIDQMARFATVETKLETSECITVSTSTVTDGPAPENDLAPQ